MERIEKAAYRFFGTSEDVVLNKANEETYNAFYEGNIETFAVQLGFVLTTMTFTKARLRTETKSCFRQTAWSSPATKRS